jgi:hypothetical protein
MAWNGDQRRSGKDRRLHERRRTTRYGVHTLVVIDGITWIEVDGADRRMTIRRREDRENVASRIVRISRP